MNSALVINLPKWVSLPFLLPKYDQRNNTTRKHQEEGKANGEPQLYNSSTKPVYATIYPLKRHPMPFYLWPKNVLWSLFLWGEMCTLRNQGNKAHRLELSNNDWNRYLYGFILETDKLDDGVEDGVRSETTWQGRGVLWRRADGSVVRKGRRQRRRALPPVVHEELRAAFPPSRCHAPVPAKHNQHHQTLFEHPNQFPIPSENNLLRHQTHCNNQNWGRRLSLVLCQLSARVSKFCFWTQKPKLISFSILLFPKSQGTNSLENSSQVKAKWNLEQSSGF